MALFRFRTFTIEKIDSIASRLKYVSQTHPPFENPPGGGGGRGGEAPKWAYISGGLTK